MLTNNSVLVENIRPTKTIMCVQRNAEKVVPTEETQVKSNLASFGDDIGKTTNKVTAMYDVQSLYEPGSLEYDTLEYRIMSGQLYQQNCIDKIKGIVCNPMPRSWYDYHANALPEDATEEQIAEREFNLRILADRKPYFMTYIYPTLRKEYRDYMKSVEAKCVRTFRMSLQELLAVPESEQTDEQREFIHYYRRRLPVGDHHCTMNRICRKIEEMFDGKMKQWTEEPFDYRIMKSEAAEYTPRQFAQIRQIYERHNEWLQEIAEKRAYRKLFSDETADAKISQNLFWQKCMGVCSNAETLTNMILDLCYTRSGSREFVWDICWNTIVSTLAARHGGIVQFPARDPDGEIGYNGMRFSMRQAAWVWKDVEEELSERDYLEREGMGEEGD